jgi:hypothetical protein
VAVTAATRAALVSELIFIVDLLSSVECLPPSNSVQASHWGSAGEQSYRG